MLYSLKKKKKVILTTAEVHQSKWSGRFAKTLPPFNENM